MAEAAMQAANCSSGAIYLSLVNVLPAIDDRHLTPCVEKQQVAPAGKQCIVLL